MQDIFWIHKTKRRILVHRREADGVQLGSRKAGVNNLKPSDPQKIEAAGFKITHARPSINHVYMICAEDLCVQEMMWIQRNNGPFSIVSKKHDIATRCPWVDNISSTLKIISCEVESNKLVVSFFKNTKLLASPS